jgi:regulatory protein
MEHYQALARFCGYQERCLQEIEAKLKETQAPKEDWDGLIASLKENGLWDEERFARSFARGKFRIKCWGRVRIQHELRLRGVSPDLIQQAFREIDQSEYFETAVKVFRKKRLECNKEADISARQKVYRYLVQKGYESALVSEILAEYWTDSE